MNKEDTIKTIKRYCEENNVFPNVISEERLKEILELGISKKTKIDDLQSQLDMANKKLDEIEGYVKLRNDELNDFKKSTINDLFNANIEKFIKDILSIIGGEEVSNE